MFTKPMSATVSGATRYPFLLHAVSGTQMTTIALVAAGAIVMGILAQISVNIGVVSITAQTFGVMVLGVTLGYRRATAAMVSYLVLGLAGVPWFANFTGGPLMVVKPTFGYVVGFVVATALVGWLAEHGWDRRVGLSLVMYATASFVIYALGLPYLWFILHLSGMNVGWMDVLWIGFFPFILGDALKCGLAAVLSPWVWSAVSRWCK